jgi:hypothetical protein
METTDFKGEPRGYLPASLSGLVWVMIRMPGSRFPESEGLRRGGAMALEVWQQDAPKTAWSATHQPRFSRSASGCSINPSLRSLRLGGELF